MYLDFMFFEIFMFPVARDFCLSTMFLILVLFTNGCFGRSWMIILRLFDRLFLRYRSSQLVSCFLGVKFRVSKRRVFSSVISFSAERERECYKSKLRFRIRVLER